MGVEHLAAIAVAVALIATAIGIARSRAGRTELQDLDYEEHDPGDA